VSINETMRTEEPIGTDLHLVKNSASTAAVTKRIQVSRRVVQKCEVQGERKWTITGGADVGPAFISRWLSKRCLSNPFRR